MLRATWANNNGELLMVHPSMSEWREWPLMLGRTVPFGDTKRGGRLKALGNPGVYWQVAACVALSTLATAVFLAVVGIRLLTLRAARRAGASAVAVSSASGVAFPTGASAAVRAGSGSSSGSSSGGDTVWAVATATNELGGGGWVVPFSTLLFGYYINLVPYELIKRSKFVYHYVPALLHGVMLTVVVADIAMKWAALQFLRPPLWLARSPLGATLWAKREVIVNCAVGGVFFIVALGFWYWGLPYAYGFPLSPEEHASRMWVSKW